MTIGSGTPLEELRKWILHNVISGSVSRPLKQAMSLDIDACSRRGRPDPSPCIVVNPNVGYATCGTLITNTKAFFTRFSTPRQLQTEQHRERHARNDRQPRWRILRTTGPVRVGPGRVQQRSDTSMSIGPLPPKRRPSPMTPRTTRERMASRRSILQNGADTRLKE